MFGWFKKKPQRPTFNFETRYDRACKDCKWYILHDNKPVGNAERHECTDPKRKKINRGNHIEGNRFEYWTKNCDMLRHFSNTDECGREGKHWEPKTTKEETETK